MGALGNTIGVLFEIAADPSRATKALSDFQTSIDHTLGLASGKSAEYAARIEKQWGLSEGSLLRTGVAAQAAAKDLAYLGVGVAGLVAGAVALADKWASAGTAIFEAAQKTGISADKLSGLRATSQVLDESFDALTMTLSRMGKNIEAGLRDPASDAGKTLQALYKSSDELRRLGLMPLSERIADVDKRIFALNSTSQQNLALTAMAGRGYNEVRSILAELARGGYEPLIELAKKLRVFFGPESAEEARQFRVQLGFLRTELSGLADTIGQQTVPALSQLILTTEIRLQQGLGKTLVQAVRDAGAGFVWFMAALDPMITHTDEFKDQVDRLTLSIAGGREETQAMTDLLAVFNALTRQAGKGTGDLGDKTDKAAKAHKVWSTDLAAVNAIYRELLGAQDPIIKAHEDYSQILQRIATATGPAYNAALLEKMAVERRDSEVMKVFVADQEKIAATFAKQGGFLPSWVSGLLAASDARTQLNAADRAALPLALDETNALARMLDNSKAAVDQMLLGELPARQRIEIQIQRQMDAAKREVLAAQQAYAQGKITLAEKEAIEEQYTRYYLSSIRERELRMTQATDLGYQAQIAQKQQLQQMREELEMSQASLLNFKVVGAGAFMSFGQAMGSSVADAIAYKKSIGEAMAAIAKSTLASLAAQAIVYAVYSTALGFLRLAQWDPIGASNAFMSAAIWGTVGGVAGAAARALPGGETVKAGAPGAQAGGAAEGGAKTGTLTGGQQQEEQQGGPRVNVYISGPIYGGEEGLRELVNDISQAVGRSDVVLHATSAAIVTRKS